MDQQRYDEIAAQLEAGIEVELPQETWREFYGMVVLKPKKIAEIRTDNFIGGHTFAYCEQCEWTGPKYGFGVHRPNEATIYASYEVYDHNRTEHHEKEQ